MTLSKEGLVQSVQSRMVTDSSVPSDRVLPIRPGPRVRRGKSADTPARYAELLPPSTLSASTHGCSARARKARSERNAVVQNPDVGVSPAIRVFAPHGKGSGDDLITWLSISMRPVSGVHDNTSHQSPSPVSGHSTTRRRLGNSASIRAPDPASVPSPENR